MTTMRKGVALMAVFDGSGRKCGERSGSRVGSASVLSVFWSSTSPDQAQDCQQTRNQGTHGPMSEGVTGSEGGGGRLIRVGVVILLVVEGAGEKLDEGSRRR